MLYLKMDSHCIQRRKTGTVSMLTNRPLKTIMKTQIRAVRMVPTACTLTLALSSSATLVADTDVISRLHVKNINCHNTGCRPAYTYTHQL